MSLARSRDRSCRVGNSRSAGTEPARARRATADDTAAVKPTRARSTGARRDGSAAIRRWRDRGDNPTARAAECIVAPRAMAATSTDIDRNRATAAAQGGGRMAIEVGGRGAELCLDRVRARRRRMPRQGSPVQASSGLPPDHSRAVPVGRAATSARSDATSTSVERPYFLKTIRPAPARDRSRHGSGPKCGSHRDPHELGSRGKDC